MQSSNDVPAYPLPLAASAAPGPQAGQPPLMPPNNGGAPLMPPASAAPAARQAAPAPAGLPSSALEAADSDVIEPAWVARVKAIIESHSYSPYDKSKLFTQLKADYLQKRYGKQLKVGD